LTAVAANLATACRNIGEPGQRIPFTKASKKDLFIFKLL
jgi:hypothetical protein